MDYNKIKDLLTDKKISFTELSEKIGMSRGGLYTAFNKDTLTIHNLEKIAEVLDLPIIALFEGQPGGYTSLSNHKQEVTENEKLKQEVNELKEQLEDKRFIIEKLKEEKEDIIRDKEEVINLLPTRKRLIYEVMEEFDSSLEIIENEYPELTEKEFKIRDGKKPFTSEQKEEIKRLALTRYSLAFEKMMKNPIVRRHWQKVSNEKDLKYILDGISK